MGGRGRRRVRVRVRLARHPDGKPFVHLHAVVSDRQCVTHGGHLFRATTGATLEFVLLVGEAPIERTLDEATGLNLWRV